jgi:fibro-slime domain-containing protein
MVYAHRLISGEVDALGRQKPAHAVALGILLVLTGCAPATDHHDASLKALAVRPGSLPFTSQVHQYAVAVPTGTDAVAVTPTANDPAASIAVSVDGAAPVVVASGASQEVKAPATGATSRIAIKVSSQDGLAHQTYSIVLSRDSSNDASLTSLSLSAGTASPAFDPATMSYTVTSPFGVASLLVTPTAAAVGARITVAQDAAAPTVVASGTPSPPLSVPPVGQTSAVAIAVTAPDGATVRSYELTLRSSGDDGCQAPCDPTAVCGDGRLAELEACDDRNVTPDDGCSATCTLEPGWACPNVGVACVAARCGDGALAGFEACDDGNVAAGDGCSAACAIEEGFACPTPANACHPTVCGDGQTEGTEQCDDGNHDLGDGCDTTCHAEPRCTNGVCAPACGDGIRAPQEVCDDGNRRSGDGCSEGCAVEPGFTCVDAPPASSATLSIPIVYRDFLPLGMAGGHIDFENAVASERGIVADQLGADGKPVYGARAGTPTTHGATAFDQWYRDVPNVNRTEVDQLVVTRTAPDTYGFDSADFFPIDGRGWQRDGGEPSRNGHNFSFTSELRYWFTYSGGETLTFRGDDDVWVYINGHLAVDLGGVHLSEMGSVTLNETTASAVGLVDGGIYEVAVFQAERHLPFSNYRLTLKGFNATKSSCAWRCGDGIATRYEVCDDGVNDGGYGGCVGCMARGPYCGDQAIDTAFGEVCDDGVNAGAYGHCGPGCTSLPRCGDAVLQRDAGEDCDDGNTGSGDGCSSLCGAEIQ